MEAKGKTILESRQAKYEALPKPQKRAEFIKRWNEQIRQFDRLLWSCADSDEYYKYGIELSEIQAKLEEIVETLSLNVK